MSSNNDDFWGDLLGGIIGGIFYGIWELLVEVLPWPVSVALTVLVLGIIIWVWS